MPIVVRTTKPVQTRMRSDHVITMTSATKILVAKFPPRCF